MKTLTFANVPHSKRLLTKCLSFSFILHFSALIVFYFNPLILNGNFLSLFGLSSAQPTPIDWEDEDLNALQKTHELEEAFEHIIVLSSHLQQPYDLVELPKGIALAPNQEHTLFEVASATEPLIGPKQEHVLSKPATVHHQEELFIPTLFSPPEASTQIASQLQIDSEPSLAELHISSIPVPEWPINEDLIVVNERAVTASFETDYALNLAPQLVSPNSLKIGNDVQIKTESKPATARITAKELNIEKELTRSTLLIPKASQIGLEKQELAIANTIDEFEQYDFPALALAAEWNDDFSAEVTFLPNPEGQGYIFSVALQPSYDLSAHSLKQNIYFILDRSHSVQKHRFAVFKRGVLKALSSMQQGDTFNIFVVDKNISSLSPHNIAVSLKNIQAAEEFLDKQEGGRLFSSSHLYSSLEKILNVVPDDEEAHTAILLTDGKNELGTERKQKLLKKWIEQNHGKLSLYAAAIGRDNDLLTLDLLSSVSGGKLLYVDTHASFPRKLAKLMLDLKDPVAKDLLISAIPHNPHSLIEFYPANSHFPTLYSHQPYVLVGQIDDPCTFDLVIQGRHRDQWIAIKKTISFSDGQKGNHELTKQWTAQQANLCYAKFLKEGKAAYLNEAKEILKKSRAEVAFE
jgi:hypothetical protein